LHFYCYIYYTNTLIVAAIIEALVPMFYEEPIIIESDAIEFLNASTEVQVLVLSSLSYREVKVVLVYLSIGALRRFILPRLQGT